MGGLPLSRGDKLHFQGIEEAGPRSPQLYSFFWWVGVTSQSAADFHCYLQQLLATLELQEAWNKSSSPSTEMGLKLNAMDMSVTLPQQKLEDVMTLIHNWAHKEVANIHELRTLLSKLFLCGSMLSPCLTVQQQDA